MHENGDVARARSRRSPILIVGRCERVLHSEARQPADGTDIWAQIGRRDGAVAHLKGELPESSLGAAWAGGAEH